MRLSIRLQQHGKKNHPYWWIVVAPQYNNIFGRFTDHIGYWSPRHNINLQRQIILNIPKTKYWLANGARPTPKIYYFLTMFGIMPEKWRYIKSAEQIAQRQSKKKPYEEMTPKQKSLEDRRRKRNQRDHLPPRHYHRSECFSMKPNKLHQRMIAKQHSQQFQNELLRNALHEADLQKFDRLAQLANNSQQALPWHKQIKNIKQKIRKSQSQLAFLQKQYLLSKFVQKSKLISKINILLQQLNSFQNIQSTINFPTAPQLQSPITQDYLQNRLKYELFTKKIQKNSKDISLVRTFHQPVTLAEFYAQLKQNIQKNPNPEEEENDDNTLHQLCEELFQLSLKQGTPITKFHLFLLSEKGQTIRQLYDDGNVDHDNDDYDDDSKQVQTQTKIYKEPLIDNHENVKTFIQAALSDQSQLPSFHPVHPRPDLKTYIPDQHYDPISINNLEIMLMDSLEPHEQIEKYHRKRNANQTVEQAKIQERNRRMARLNLFQKY